jgi:hypothetical protein
MNFLCGYVKKSCNQHICDLAHAHCRRID